MRRSDSRSDVFAFGSTLYEIATAQPPFQGQTVTETLAKILEAEPLPLSGVRSGLPADFDRIVRRCLQKKPADRYHDTRDLLADLKALRQQVTSGFAPGSVPPKRSNRVPWIVGAVGAGAALLVAGTLLIRSKSENRSAQLASFNQVTFVGDAAFPAASPDGQFLAYVTGGRGEQKTIVQDLTGGRTLEVFRGQRLGDVEWSPDGSSLLVTSEAGLSIVPRLGGPARAFGRVGHRASWSPDGSEIATVTEGASLLHFVNTSTGAVRSVGVNESLTFIKDVDWSPTGEWILFSAADASSRAMVWIVKPDGSGLRQLLEDEPPTITARWAPRGDAIYYLKGAPTQDLWKLPFERTSGRPAGPAVPLLSGLEAGPDFHVFRDGRRLVYTGNTGRANLWLGVVETRTNQAIQARELTRGTLSVREPSFSPDSARIAYASSDGTASNIFVVPIDGGAPQQITFMRSMNGSPVWSPDGRTIAFGSTEGGSARVWRVPAVGGVPSSFANTSLSRDTLKLAWAPGRDILYQRSGNRNFSLLEHNETESPFLTNDQTGWIFFPSYSPDGNAVATSLESVLGRRYLCLSARRIHSPRRTCEADFGKVVRRRHRAKRECRGIPR